MSSLMLEELPACPVETTLALIGNKWQVLILRDLSLNGTMRFKELQRSIGKISQKVLTSNLRAMEDAGIVHREVFAEVPRAWSIRSPRRAHRSNPCSTPCGRGVSATRKCFKRIDDERMERFARDNR